MPLYVYQCKDCEEEFEKTLRFSEASQPQVCPTCHSQDTRQENHFFCFDRWFF